MAAIIKQNFTLAYVRALITNILKEAEYKLADPSPNSPHNDLKSTLLSFAACVWHQAHKTSMIEIGQADGKQDHSLMEEHSFLQALQIDQKTLRSSLLDKDKQIQFLTQELHESQRQAKEQSQTISVLKQQIVKLTEAYQEAKSIFDEELHKKGETGLLSESSDPRKLEIYELSYQLSTTQRSLSFLQDKLDAAMAKLREKEHKEQTLEGQSMIQKNDILRMQKRVALLEEANSSKKQKIEELLRLLSSEKH